MLIAGYLTVILFLSIVSLNGSISLNKSKVLGFRSDYLSHIFLFIPWMILAKSKWKGSNWKNAFWFALVFGIFLAGISEAVQLLLSDRTFNLIDLAANCMGIVIGAVIAGWGRSKKVVNS